MYQQTCGNYGWNVFLAGKSVAYLKGKPLLFSTRQSIAVISTQYPAFAADQGVPRPGVPALLGRSPGCEGRPFDVVL